MTTDARRGSRLRLAALLVPPVLAVGLFIAWAQPWVVLTLDDGVRIAAGGDRAAAVLPAIAVASLALTSALALATARIRPVLGALLALLGALVVAVSLRAAGDPVAAAASSVTALTGVEGENSVRALVDTAALTDERMARDRRRARGSARRRRSRHRDHVAPMAASSRAVRPAAGCIPRGLSCRRRRPRPLDVGALRDERRERPAEGSEHRRLGRAQRRPRPDGTVD